MLLCAWAALSGSGVASAASGKEDERVFQVTGVVRARLDGGQLVVEHDEIPGYMPAMTMAFTPASPEEANRLKVNDRVRFRLRTGGGRSLAEAFVVTGRAAAPEKPAASSAGNPRPGRLREGDAVPAFSLLNEQGRSFTAEALQGRFTVVTFIFTRCPVPEFCPAISLKFRQLQSAVRTELPADTASKARLLAITLDPEFDRPDILKAYGEAMGADPATWNFATGKKEEIDALVKAFAVYRETNGVTLDHTLTTALVGPDGRLAEIWRGNSWTVDEVVASLKKSADVAGH
ncbi:electron transporter SenC [Opitutaceae bacterium TAV5]|nr:electron transporter SenC [Opitutaceae bacterium TAV5]